VGLDGPLADHQPAGDLGTVNVPVWDSLKPVSLVITLVAAALLFRWKWSVLRTLGDCALLGVGGALIGLAVA
jgi:chromate transporter